MPSTNVAEYAISLQSAKGAVAAAPQYRFDVTGADLKPTPEVETREETGLGRDEGDTYIRLLSAAGGAEVLARPKTLGLFAYGALGAKAVTSVGTTWAATTAYTSGQVIIPTNTTTNPYTFEVTTGGTTGASEPTWPTTVGATVVNGSVTFTNRGGLKYSHANTPAADQPWFTIWRSIGGSIHERFEDCKIAGISFSGEAGGDLAVSLTLMGLRFERLTSGIPAGGVYEQGEPLRVPDYEILVDSVNNDAVTEFSFGVEAGQSGIQTNKINYSYMEPTGRTATGSYTEVYQNITTYAKSLYGSGTGTTPATKLYEAPWQATFGNFAYGPGVRINVPRALISPIQMDPDTGAEPMMMPVEFKPGRPSSGSIYTISVINDVQTYPAAA